MRTLLVALSFISIIFVVVSVSGCGVGTAQTGFVPLVTEKMWDDYPPEDVDAAFELVKDALALEYGIEPAALDLGALRIVVIWTEGEFEWNGDRLRGLTRCIDSHCAVIVAKYMEIWQTALIHEILHAYGVTFLGHAANTHPKDMFCYPPDDCIETRLEARYRLRFP